MNVFVVVTLEGKVLSFVAKGMSDAIVEYEMAGGELNSIAGVFVYGKHDLLTATIREFEQ